MMYNQKLVASIKANGRILRETKGTVLTPFGSEYSIVLKNLDVLRVIVNITIDGTDVCPGGLVIDPSQTVDLERWIKNGNLKEGNKFKFIERSAAIENGPRGIQLEDGLINITYQFEQVVRQLYTVPQQNNILGPYYGHSSLRSMAVVGGQIKSVDHSKDGWASAQAGANIEQYCADHNISTRNSGVTMDSMSFSDKVSAQAASARSFNEVGITVPGSKSEQSFKITSAFPVLPEKHNIVFKLLGETPDNKPIVEAVTVKAKPKCVTCGKLNKANSKFCSQCGTALEIL